MRPLEFTRKAASALLGLASREGRVKNAARLLRYFLQSLPLEERTRWLEFAPLLPEELFAATSRIYPSKTSLLQMLPKGGIVAEVGVYQGRFSRKIAEICEPNELHLIDMDLSPLEPFDFPATLHEGDSVTILDGFPAEHFDWLYIDADHSYAGVSRDLKAAHRVLKPGGYLMCNDYSNWCADMAVPFGVARAVNELILAERYTVHGMGLHPAGLHDILIRKPLAGQAASGPAEASATGSRPSAGAAAAG